MYCRRRHGGVSEMFCLNVPTELTPLYYHGLVDVSASLELQESVGVGGGCLGVFEGTPSFCG